MNGLSLQRFTAVSLALHLLIFGLTLLTIKRSSRFLIPSYYSVDIVGPDFKSKDKGHAEAGEDSGESKAQTNDHSSEVRENSRTGEQRLSERLDALKAKKKIEKINRLRKMISVKGDINTKNGKSEKGARGKALSSLQDYSAKAGEEIKRCWTIPMLTDKGIETIVSVKLTKDGSIKFLNFEKKSGNRLFDRSILMAINNCSVTPPPSDMEIGIRFRP